MFMAHLMCFSAPVANVAARVSTCTFIKPLLFVVTSYAVTLVRAFGHRASAGFHRHQRLIMPLPRAL